LSDLMPSPLSVPSEVSGGFVPTSGLRGHLSSRERVVRGIEGGQEATRRFGIDARRRAAVGAVRGRQSGVSGCERSEPAYRVLDKALLGG
jgi:hypothetical protein